MSARLARASDAEAAALWPAVASARLFDSAEEYEAFRARFPWAVPVTSRGEAAVVERWREHLPVLAVRGLWCSRRRVPAMVADLAAIAAEHGFGRLLSPVVSEAEAAPYERAGMKRLPELLSYRHASIGDGGASDAPPGVKIRTASEDDLDALLELDAGCFEEFWRYDRLHVRRRATAGDLTVAECGGHLLGYTQRATRGAVCTFGRVAVSADARRAGLGTALVLDALGRARSEGASRVSLCTHEHNSAARRLYARTGFVEAPGRLVLLIARA